MSHDPKSNHHPYWIRSTLSQVRAHQQNEYEIALRRKINEHEKELRLRLKLSKSRSERVAHLSDQRPPSLTNLSAAAAAARAAERRALAAARKAANKVALVPWNKDAFALAVVEDQARPPSTSLPIPFSLSQTIKSPTLSVPIEPPRCISPRMFRLAKEFTREAQEYDQRRQRMREGIALASDQRSFQISRARSPHCSAAHRPAFAFATSQSKQRRRDFPSTGHRLGSMADMEGSNLDDVPLVHRRHAGTSARTYGRIPTATRNSPNGSNTNLKDATQTPGAPARTLRRIPPSGTSRPGHIANSHNCNRVSTQPSKPKTSGTWQMLAARHAARRSRKFDGSSASANRTLPKAPETLELARIEDRGETQIAGGSRPLPPPPLNNDFHFRGPGARSMAASQPAPPPPPPPPPRAVGRREARSSSLPASQIAPDHQGVTSVRSSYARRRPLPPLVRTTQVSKPNPLGLESLKVESRQQVTCYPSLQVSPNPPFRSLSQSRGCKPQPIRSDLVGDSVL